MADDKMATPKMPVPQKLIKNMMKRYSSDRIARRLLKRKKQLGLARKNY